MDIQELSAILRAGGIVGAGGAGFPAYAKLDRRTETIILNCAECEPLLKLHRQLLEKYAREIIDTLHLMAVCVGAREVVIGIKKAYQEAIATLHEHIAVYQEIRLGLLDSVYPAGDEVILIYETTGKTVPPGGFPIAGGIAVFNVETVYNIHRLLNQSQPVTDKLVTVAGAVPAPVTRRIPLGSTIAEAVAAAGGSRCEQPVYWLGGPMMGDIGTATQPVLKTTNAILVLPPDHLLVRRKKRTAAIDLKRAAAACCQCSMCTDLCPRQLLGHPIEPHKFMRAAICHDTQDTDIFLNTMFCSSCGLCENYSCMQGLSPRTLIADCKAGLKAHGIKPPTDVLAAPVPAARDLRQVPLKRLTARLDLVRYEKPAPLNEELLPVTRVTLPLGQHIGAPAVPIVRPGDTVAVGQMLAEPATGLSVALHASLDGQVSAVTDRYIIIQK